jgi:hypothetical protein
MALRTIKIMGYASTEGVRMTLRLDSSDLFDGAVPIGTEAVEIGTFEQDSTKSGNFDGIIKVTGGDMTFVGLMANYMKCEHISNTDGEGNVHPAVTVDDVVNNFEYFDNGSNDSKVNMNVNGVDLDQLDKSDFVGNWHVALTDGDMLLCDFVIDAQPQPPTV